MTLPSGVGEAVEEGLAAIERLFEDAEDPADIAAVSSPMMPPDVMALVGEYLAVGVDGVLTAHELRNEARMWLEVALAGWPFDSPTARTVVRGLLGLAGIVPDDQAPLHEPPVSTPLEKALAAAIDDPEKRPALWKALWYGTIFLPVAEVDFDGEEAAAFRFAAADIGGEPTVFGFTTEERLDLVIPAGEPIGRVEPTGQELARLWPETQWLILNPGFALSTVLSPAEIQGLPDGPRLFLPDDITGTVAAPGSDELHRLGALKAARRRVTGVSALHWAVIRPDQPGERSRDVVVIDPAEDAKPAAVLAAFVEATSASVFGNAVILVADASNDARLCQAVRSSGLGVP